MFAGTACGGGELPLSREVLRRARMWVQSRAAASRLSPLPPHVFRTECLAYSAAGGKLSRSRPRRRASRQPSSCDCDALARARSPGESERCRSRLRSAPTLDARLASDAAPLRPRSLTFVSGRQSADSLRDLSCEPLRGSPVVGRGHHAVHIRDRLLTCIRRGARQPSLDCPHHRCFRHRRYRCHYHHHHHHHHHRHPRPSPPSPSSYSPPPQHPRGWRD